MTPMDLPAITWLDWALILLRILVLVGIGGFLAGMVVWRSAIWDEIAIAEEEEKDA